MPSKPPVIFPQEQRLLAALGERMRLARKRRKLTTSTVAQRAGISRSSLYNVEAGDGGATMGTYLRVLAVLGLEADINTLAADDKVGRKLQDLALEPGPPSRARKRSAKPGPPVAGSGASRAADSGHQHAHRRQDDDDHHDDDAHGDGQHDGPDDDHRDVDGRGSAR